MSYIYSQKLLYYKNKLVNNKSDDYNKNLYKLNKYKYKMKYYSDSKCNIPNCTLKYDPLRNPSYCDRILYKGSSITPIKYDVYDDEGFIRLSDHLMVYSIFNYNNRESIIFTWNIGKLHSDKDIKCGIQKLLDFFSLLNPNTEYEYIVFCLQESPDDDNFIKILIELFNKKYKVSINSSKSHTQQNVRLVVFNKMIGTLLENVSNYKVQLNSDILSSSVAYLGTLAKKFLGTKAAVLIKFKDIAFISCHLPIDVDIEKPDNYLGNNLRIDALNEIIEANNNSNNVIIAGDLNFRIKPTDGIDQLNELFKGLEEYKEYKEFGILPEGKQTCKIVSCYKQK
jgi:exonuclease III